jgi:hypothetical protein
MGEENDMPSPLGTWAVVISTPIGKQHVTLRIDERDGRLEGTATQGAETVSLVGARLDGARLTWSQSVTRPMKLAIKFDVNIAGDRMLGTAKAGILPTSKLEGARGPGQG